VEPTLAVALIAAIAFFVQAYAGFGAALVLTPLLALVIDLRMGVAASSIVQLPVGIWLAYGARASIDRPSLWRLVPIGAIGLAAGAYALASVDVIWLKRICGGLTALFALDMLRRTLQRTVARPWPAWAAPIAGLLGGLLGGLFGTSGPPIVAYLERPLERGATIRATLLAYFLALNSMRLLAYGATSLLGVEVALLAATMLPAALAGAWAGSALQRRSAEGTFRVAVAAILLVTGVALAVR
jgi:uncharacterized membrane protein YfcA